MTGFEWYQGKSGRLTRFLIGSFAALSVMAVVLVTALFFLDLGILRGQIEAGGARAFDRQMTIEGAMSLKPSLRPWFVAEDVRIGNPDWASRPDFAHVERLEVQLALLPLLLGRLEVLDVVFSGADVRFEVGAGDSNNFTFGRRTGPPELPDIQRFKVRDTMLAYRDADGELHTCRVREAEAMNTPGQPISLAGQLACREVPLRFSVSAGTPEGFESRTSPWPLQLTVSTGDASLTAEGLLPKPRFWDGAEFRVSVQAERLDSLENLFDIALPVPGSFDLSAKLRTSAEAYSVSGLEGRIGATDITGALDWIRTGERPLLKGRIATGSVLIPELFTGTEPGTMDKKATPAPLDRPVPLDWLAAIDAELELDVQQIMDSPVPIRNAVATARLSNGRLTLSPWRASLAGAPVTGELTISPAEGGAEFGLAAGIEQLDLGEVFDTLEPGREVEGSLENLTLSVSTRGHTLRALLQGAELNLKTQTGRISSADDKAGMTRTLDITAVEIGTKQAGPMRVEAEVEYQGVPLALIAETMTLEALVSETESWPLSMEARSPQATLTADGSIHRGAGGTTLEIQTTLDGERTSSLNPLLGTALPDTGPYRLSAAFSNAGETNTLSGLEGKIGATDITGELQWTAADGRTLLKGKLVSQSMRVQDFFSDTAARPARSSAADVFDQPMPIDWLAAIDAELDLDVRRFMDSPVSIRGATAVFQLNQGKLSVSPMRATLAGNPMTGVLSIVLDDQTPEIRFEAQASRLDLGSLLEQLGADAPFTGAADNTTLEVKSHGRTMRTLAQRADLHLNIQGGRITPGDDQPGKSWILDIGGATIEARQAKPVKLSVNGNFGARPFALVADTVTLEGLVTGTRPWPLDLSLQSSDASLNADGSVTHPLEGKGLDLEFELTGKDLRELDPLIDYVIPLRGNYRIAGHFSDDTNRYSLGDIQVEAGQSDMSGSIVFDLGEPRPRINANLRSQTVHYDDLEFVEGAEEHQDKTRIIPEYVFPVETLRAVDLDARLEAGRIRLSSGDLGDLAVTATIENGATLVSARVRNERSGSILTYKLDVNAAIDPPFSTLKLMAHDLDYGLILTDAETVDLAEGRVDLDIQLAGPGATQRSFLGQANGHITVIGGPGRIASQQYGLWSSDLVITMLSRGWRRESMMDINCIVGRIEVEDGIAKTDELLLDTNRLTIAGSGTLNLDTEGLDILLVPRPKQASLVSVANPVNVTGTLVSPKVAVTVLPRQRNIIRGLAAGLINPALLVFTFSDLGSGGGNPCVTALENRDAAAND